MMAMRQRMRQLGAFGLPDISGADQPVRARIMLYAFKLLGRLTGPHPNTLQATR